MIERTLHDDVTALRLTWWRSRVLGYGVYVYLVRNVLIETGFPAVAPEIGTLARERRLRGAIVTHQHEDHAGNAEALAQIGVPLSIDARTVRVLASPYPIGAYRHFVWRAMPAFRSSFQPFVDDTLVPVHTPGHSTDHHVVWDSTTDTLFTGDLFLGVRVRVAHPYEDPRTQIASLRAMIERRPARVFCGHRGLVPGGVRALSAKVEWMEQTLGQIAELHTRGAGTREIRRRVLGSRGSVHWISAGDYSPDNLVRAALRGSSPAAGT